MGYAFRSRLERTEKGNVSVIQMKDLSEDNRVECGELFQIDMADLKDRHLVKRGDIVLRSRGQTNTSALIDQEIVPTVVAAPLLRIRVKTKEVLPGYLSWFINQPMSQTWLASHAKGTAVRMISKQVLENLEVIVPPLTQQHRIIALAALAKEEQRLLKELAEKRRQYMEGILMLLASESQGG
ncbi:MAG: hypothetical protein Kow0060_21100 [Methylohalobius crimeensis]